MSDIYKPIYLFFIVFSFFFICPMYAMNKEKEGLDTKILELLAVSHAIQACIMQEGTLNEIPCDSLRAKFQELEKERDITDKRTSIYTTLIYHKNGGSVWLG